MLDLIPLKAGPSITRQALELAIDLELKGITLKAEDGRLVASPGDKLTDADIAAIKASKWHLLELVAYCATPPRPDGWPT